MSADLITNISLSVICVWATICVVGALGMARHTQWNPLAPEEPEHH